MRLKSLAPVVALAVLGLVSPASAALVTVTYSGTISDSFDLSGLFGPPGGNLNGDAFTLVYYFNTSIGLVTSSSSISNFAYGGTVYGASVPSPSLGAYLTINNHREFIGGSYFGIISGYNDGSYSQQNHAAGTVSFPGGIEHDDSVTTEIYNYSATLPASITSDFTYNIQPGDTVSGSFDFYTYDFGVGALVNTYGNLDTTELSEKTGLSAIPEPSTWSMMLLGFAGLGIVGYRRTRRRRSMFFTVA